MIGDGVHGQLHVLPDLNAGDVQLIHADDHFLFVAHIEGHQQRIGGLLGSRSRHDGGYDTVLRRGDCAGVAQGLHLLELRRLLGAGFQQRLIAVTDRHVDQVADAVALPLAVVLLDEHAVDIAFFRGGQLIGHVDMRRGRAQGFALVDDLHLAALLAVGVGEGDGGYAVFQGTHGAVQRHAVDLDGHGIVDLPVLLSGEFHVHPPIQGQKDDCAVLIHHVLNIGALGEINLLDTPILRHLEIRRGGIVPRQRGDFGFCGLKLRFQRFNGGLQGHGVNVQKRLPGGHGVARFHQSIRHRHGIVQRHIIGLADGQRARTCDRLGKGPGGNGIFRIGAASRGLRGHSLP